VDLLGEAGVDRAGAHRDDAASACGLRAGIAPDVAPPQARTLAKASLVLWLAAITAGRFDGVREIGGDVFLTFASWLHKTPISIALQHQVAWLWPFCETLHFAGLALLLGVAGMFDLRLMGFMKRVPIMVIKEFMPWALVGFSLNLMTG